MRMDDIDVGTLRTPPTSQRLTERLDQDLLLALRDRLGRSRVQIEQPHSRGQFDHEGRSRIVAPGQ